MDLINLQVNLINPKESQVKSVNVLFKCIYCIVQYHDAAKKHLHNPNCLCMDSGVKSGVCVQLLSFLCMNTVVGMTG